MEGRAAALENRSGVRAPRDGVVRRRRHGSAGAARSRAVTVRSLIVHPTDFSAASTPAFNEAIRLARASGAMLVLLHVLNPLMPPDIGKQYVAPPTYRQLRKAWRAWALKRLSRLTARASVAKVRSEPIVREGAEATEIARVARSRRASMIVMGTHGRSGFRRALVGSVATRVLTLAPCPVLTVRRR